MKESEDQCGTSSRQQFRQAIWSYYLLYGVSLLFHSYLIRRRIFFFPRWLSQSKLTCFLASLSLNELPTNHLLIHFLSILFLLFASRFVTINCLCFTVCNRQELFYHTKIRVPAASSSSSFHSFFDFYVSAKPFSLNVYQIPSLIYNQSYIFNKNIYCGLASFHVPFLAENILSLVFSHMLSIKRQQFSFHAKV